MIQVEKLSMRDAVFTTDETQTNLERMQKIAETGKTRDFNTSSSPWLPLGHRNLEPDSYLFKQGKASSVKLVYPGWGQAICRRVPADVGSHVNIESMSKSD